MTSEERICKVLATLGLLVFWVQASVMDEMPPFPEKGSRLLEKLKKKDPKQARIHEDKPTGVDDMGEAKIPDVTNPVVPEVESKTDRQTHALTHMHTHTHVRTNKLAQTHRHSKHLFYNPPVRILTVSSECCWRCKPCCK